VRCAIRLALATGKGSWIDFVFELFTSIGRPLPAPVIDELYTVLRKVQPVSIPVLRRYIQTLRDSMNEFGPAERFLIQRIEGLERLATSV
jgi:hypothetical protein